ncbi:MAG: N-formylglutamate amidohydrolase [Caulobacteraceae bacterium]
MNAWEPLARSLDDDEEALETFSVALPPADAPRTPLVFASPHSGRVYPARMMARLTAPAIRRSEDAFMDALIEAAPAHGARLIAARLARVFLDVNREPWELDPAMFEDELPAYARARTARVAAGLGAIAKVVCEGEEVYGRKLRFAEAQGRIEAVHRPYHAALAGLVSQAKADHGLAILIDWHSMPAAAGEGTRSARPCQMVLGDRFGGSCAPAISRLVETTLGEIGYAVARNAPYAGGYTTEHYGRPTRRVHALQIEISRALYLDEATLEPTAGFATLKANLEHLFAALANTDWAALAN